jgi:outer membrane protein TolC
MNMQSAEAGWRLGNINLLEKQQAKRRQLLGQRQQWQLQPDQASAMIALYKALGGDWQAPVDGANTSKQSGVVQ